jgi:hypothetical protein
MYARSLIPRLYRPEVYQGRKVPDRYFEGWYFKLVDAAGEQVWSFIAGVAYASKAHSFVQAIHANSGRTWYQEYPLEAFTYSRKEFLAYVGPSRFSSHGISLSLDLPGLKVSGQIQFEGTHPFPSTVQSPGIMGWYRYAPRMECYHGVVSMQHTLRGTLVINGSPVDFTQGKGYTEKDWGRSMPSDWIWIQSNHFRTDPQASFMISLARIPWMKGYFPGFLSFFMHNGQIHRFATYNRSRVTRIELAERSLHLAVENRHYQLNLEVYRNRGGTLKAPRHGSMERVITESVVSEMTLELRDRKGPVLFSDSGIHTGLEIVGDVAQYFRNYH